MKLMFAFLAFILLAAFAIMGSDERFDRLVESFKNAYPNYVHMSETERNRAWDRFVSQHTELKK
jgi:hypothetical protein